MRTPADGTTATTPSSPMPTADRLRSIQELIRRSTLYVDIIASEIVDRAYELTMKLAGFSRPPGCEHDEQWMTFVVPRGDADMWVTACKQHPGVIVRVFGIEGTRAP